MSVAEQKKRIKEKVSRKGADESAILPTGEKDGAVTTESRIHCLSIIGQIEGHYLLPEGQKATKYDRRTSDNTEHDGRRR